MNISEKRAQRITLHEVVSCLTLCPLPPPIYKIFVEVSIVIVPQSTNPPLVPTPSTVTDVPKPARVVTTPTKTHIHHNEAQS